MYYLICKIYDLSELYERELMESILSEAKRTCIKRYQERLKPKNYKRKTYWHRIRSRCFKTKRKWQSVKNGKKKCQG